MRAYAISLIALLAITLSGCGFSPAVRQDEGLAPSAPLAPLSQEPLSTPLPDLPSEGDTTEMPSTTPADSGLQSLIEKAQEDLAQRLNVSVTQINFIEAKAVAWPDSSLGCPQPGMAYLQVPEDGALIILQVEGIVYEYHNGGSRDPFLCEMNYKDPDPPPQIDIFNLTPPKSTTPTTPDNSIPPGGDK